jgi:ABC-type antimicrobial peptide transport system permease subunit
VAQTPWWVLLAALLAAAWPAWKAARTDIAVAVKSE